MEHFLGVLALRKETVKGFARNAAPVSYTHLSFGTGTNAIGNLLSKRDAALDFIAPYIPAFVGLAGEKFDARDIAHELDDAVSGFLRFLGVLFNVAHDDLHSIYKL